MRFTKIILLTGLLAAFCFAQSNYLSAPWPYVYGTNPAGARTLANTAGVITSTTGVAVPIAAATGALTAGASGTSYVYWANSGNALSLTGTASTATTAPNVLVATVVAGSGSITSIAMVGNFTPLQFTNYRTPPVDLVAGITDTQDINGQIWFSQINIPVPTVLTGACVLTGTATTDSITMGLWNSAGALVANSALAGATLGTASRMSCQAFTVPYYALPGTYYAGIQGNGGTAASFYCYGTAQPTGFGTGTVAAGTFGTLTAISPSVIYTASVGPVMSVY